MKGSWLAGKGFTVKSQIVWDQIQYFASIHEYQQN